MKIEPSQLIAAIEEAFAGVALGNGISLNECEYNDSGGSRPEYLSLAKSDERDDWHKLANTPLTDFQVTFSFTDREGCRFYLPAYMIWTIQNFSTSDSIIGHMTIYACDPDSHQFKDIAFGQFFDPKQLQAIILFLEFCVQNDGPLDGSAAYEYLQKILANSP